MKAVRHFYSNMADVSSNDPQVNKTVKLPSRSHKDLQHLQDPFSHPFKKKSRLAGAGHKTKALQVTIVLLNWFVDVREQLKNAEIQ